MARDHAYYKRNPKPCTLCGTNQCMPSASYCKECHREYDRERKARIKKIVPEKKNQLEPESGIINQIINGAHDNV